MAIFFPDAVGRGTSFSGEAPDRSSVWRLYGTGKDGTRQRPVDDIVSHYLASDNLHSAVPSSREW
jgi:hypothetical protein